MSRPWYCAVCGIPRAGWDGKTRCVECNTASVSSQSTYGWVEVVFTDGTRRTYSLRRGPWRQDASGIRVGSVRLPWEAIRQALALALDNPTNPRVD